MQISYFGRKILRQGIASRLTMAIECRRVISLCLVGRDIAESDIPAHGSRDPLRRLAEAAAAGGEEHNGFARPNQDMAELPRQCFFPAVALNECAIRFCFFSTQQSPGRALDSVRIATDKKVVQRLHLDFDTDTATEFSGAAAVGT